MFTWTPPCRHRTNRQSRRKPPSTAAGWAKARHLRCASWRRWKSACSPWSAPPTTACWRAGDPRSRVGAGVFLWCRRPGIGARGRWWPPPDPQLLPNTALGLVGGVLGQQPYQSAPAGPAFCPKPGWKTPAPGSPAPCAAQPLPASPPRCRPPGRASKLALRGASSPCPILHEQLLITHGATRCL